MAVPKVFISSTCFDLSEIRDQLSKFVCLFGFDPVLSEHGDVFYHPDLHTHEACVHEVTNCQLLILVVGGRFGGGYIHDKEKSITNAEYEAAKAANIPVFTYVKNSVLSNHHIYRENKSQQFIDQINFPAIDKQEDAESIFKFIEDVRRSPVNNAFEGFSNFNDIEEHLRKQWAGMFFEFLRTREVKSQIDATNHLLLNLKGSNAKLEALVKSLYRSSSEDEDKVEQSINEIEIYSKTIKFFSEIFDIDNDMPIELGAREHVSQKQIDKIVSVNASSLDWKEYLVETGLFYIDTFGNDDDDDEEQLIYMTDDYAFDIESSSKHRKTLIEAYEFGVRLASKEQVQKALLQLLE